MSHESSPSYLFTFEAKGLQNFIFSGGRLRYMIGGNALVGELCDEALLEKRIVACGGSEGDFKILEGAAGGGKITFTNAEVGKRFARLFPIFCSRFAPGLTVVQDFREIKGKFNATYAEAREALLFQRKFPPKPRFIANPSIERCARTGQPAVVKDEKDGLIDASLKRRMERRDRFQEEQKGEVPDFFEKFDFKTEKQIPNSFEDLRSPFHGYYALIHADANSLGRLFMSLGEASEDDGVDDDKAQTLFSEVAKVKDEAMKVAVKAGMRAVKDLYEKFKSKPHPILPLVLAGDDLTVVCRTDLAIPFTEAFLKKFRAYTSEKFEMLTGPQEMVSDLPKGLSAGAGIVYSPLKFPFNQAYDLLEHIASQAKGKAKKHKVNDKTPCPSGLTFYTIDDSLNPQSIKEIRDREWKGDGVTFEAGPYFVDGDQQPQLSQFQIIADAADDLPGGKVRELVTQLRQDRSALQGSIDQLRKVHGGNLTALDFALKGAGFEGFSKIEALKTSPLADVLHYHKFSKSPDLPKKQEHEVQPQTESVQV